MCFALHTPQPFEKGVLVKDNQVLAEINEDFTIIDISPYSDKMTGATVFHGHPKLGDYTFPVSLEDYLVLISQRYYKNNKYRFRKDNLLFYNISSKNCN